MTNPYESTDLLNQYLLFHFGTEAQQLAFPGGPVEALHFPQRCAALARRAHDGRPAGRALDLGCAVGGSSFALSEFFSEVIGIDFSSTFIGAAERMGRDGAHPCERSEEGAQFTSLSVHLPSGVRPKRVHFEQGDAQALRPDLEQFDLVLACNLICRLNTPELLLQRLPDLVASGGTLLITTPLTWMDAYTPQAAWLSQPRQSGFDGLQRALQGAFTSLAVEDIPFLIREHRRKYQYSVAQASLWRRK